MGWVGGGGRFKESKGEGSWGVTQSNIHTYCTTLVLRTNILNVILTPFCQDGQVWFNHHQITMDCNIRPPSPKSYSLMYFALCLSLSSVCLLNHVLKYVLTAPLRYSVRNLGCALRPARTFPSTGARFSELCARCVHVFSIYYYG